MARPTPWAHLPVIQVAKRHYENHVVLPGANPGFVCLPKLNRLLATIPRDATWVILSQGISARWSRGNGLEGRLVLRAQYFHKSELREVPPKKPRVPKHIQDDEEMEAFSRGSSARFAA